MDRLLGAFDRIWRDQAGLSEEIKARQREGVSFLIDLLSDEVLWQFPDFYPRLAGKILRSLDDHVSRPKARLIILTYLDAAADQIKRLQSNLMEGGGYIEPDVEKPVKAPWREADFRRVPD